MMLKAILVLVWILHPFTAAFTVKVVSGPVTVSRGATASLPCEFTSDHDLSTLVITWQRMEDSRVVHSYYYQRDQLDRQSSSYRNRTKLDKQIVEGNATLEIKNFGLEDEGEYLCVVTNTLGSDRGVVKLVYAAVYSEPRLSIHVKSNNVTIQYETEGFPKPEVVWHDSGGQILKDLMEVSSKYEGLYYIKSSYVTQNPAFNIIFTLKNPAVHQEMQRLVVFSYDGNTHNYKEAVIILAFLCVALTLSTCILLWFYCRTRRTNTLETVDMPNSNSF